MTAGLGLLAALVCACSVAYQWLGAVLAARWLAEAGASSTEALPPSTEALPPVTLLRPLKTGVPNLDCKLDELARALQPDDQLVLGAAEDSPELASCRALQRAQPGRDIVVVSCREGAAVNPKISKLVQMDAACRHERLILTDSEAVIDRAWLDALRREWHEHEFEVLTTPYRFTGAMNWPQRLDAAAALLALWPGLAVLRRWGRVDFTLGAGTALRRRELLEVGGWAAFGDWLAEDRELGAALAAQGKKIRLAATVTTLESDALGWAEWWRHQCRVATTYRVARPAGFAGSLVTHGATAALVLALLPGPPALRPWFLGWALLSPLLRWLAARRLARTAGFAVPGLLLCVFVAGWMESIAWVQSWFANRVWWSGRWWQVCSRGHLRGTPAPTVG